MVRRGLHPAGKTPESGLGATRSDQVSTAGTGSVQGG
jgi:hypothetical protein